MVGVHVESGAVICAGAVLKAGVRVGARSVVEMGAVVTRDIPTETVVFSNPARVRYSVRVSRKEEKVGRGRIGLLFVVVSGYFFLELLFELSGFWFLADVA